VTGPFLLLQAAPRGYFEGFASDIVQALLALLGVCAIAVWTMRYLSSRFPRLGLAPGPVRVVQRIALEPRRTLYLVQAGSRLLLIGFGEAHSPVLLAELDPQNIPLSFQEASESGHRISARFNRWINRNPHDRVTPER
jgi:flagellar biogenesis protein FliO